MDIYIPDEQQPLIEKLRKALIDLDSIDDLLEEMCDATTLNDPADFQIKNANRIRTFLHKELHRRECALLERFQQDKSP